MGLIFVLNADVLNGIMSFVRNPKTAVTSGVGSTTAMGTSAGASGTKTGAGSASDDGNSSILDA